MAEHKEKDIVEAIEAGKIKLNRISVADFEVESSTESMDKLEQTMDSLIKKHEGFVTLRRAKHRIDRMIG